jgi:thioredoxin 2
MNETQAPRKATVPCPICGRLNRVRLVRLTDRPVCGECGRPLLLDRPLIATDDNFEKLIAGSDVPVLVDFYADWCGPCKVMAPVLDEVARTRRGDAVILKLDTDRNPRVAQRYGIQSIPTLILFHAGREANRQVGAARREAIEAMLTV